MNIAESVSALAEITATKLMVKLELDAEAKSPFLGIIVELLPFLADLLGKNCAPENAAGLSKIVNSRGWRGRLFRWHYNAKLKQLIGSQEDYNDWGKPLGVTILEVITDADNAELVTTAMKSRPEPIWGVFSSSAVLLVGFFLCFPVEEAQAQLFRTNQYGQTIDDDGDVVVSILGTTSTQPTVRVADSCPHCGSRGITNSLPTFSQGPTTVLYGAVSRPLQSIPIYSPRFVHRYNSMSHSSMGHNSMSHSPMGHNSHRTNNRVFSGPVVSFVRTLSGALCPGGNCN